MILLERIAGVALECREGLQRRPVPGAEEVDELVGRFEPEGERPLLQLQRGDRVAEELAEVGLGAPEHRRLHAGGGGTCAPTVRKSSPMNPSGVQLARAIVPPGRQTRRSSAAACAWSGANIDPNTDVTASERRVRERQGFGVAFEQLDGEALGLRPEAAALEQRRDVVDADGRAAVAGRGDRGVAAAGGDVEDAPAGLEVGGVAEVLGDEHDPGGDDGEVAARPGRLLARLTAPRSGVVVSSMSVIDLLESCH